jgi:hypothetical protein
MPKGNSKILLIWLLLAIGIIQTKFELYAQSVKSLEYKICATKKISTFEKELNELALKGFRVDPNTKLSTSTAILSKPKSETGKKYEYKLVDPVALKKQKSGLLSSNYKFIATLFDTSGAPFSTLKFYLLFEKEEQRLNSVQDYDVCELKQKCLDEGQTRGYAPFAVSSNLLFSLLPKDSTSSATTPKLYKILSTIKMSTLEKELNEASQQGFRFLMNSNLAEVLMIKEVNSNITSHYEYVVALANKEEEAENLNELSRKGFHSLGNRGVGGYIIFERLANAVSSDLISEFKILSTKSEEQLATNLEESTNKDWKPIFIGGTSYLYNVVFQRILPTKGK